MIDGDSIKKALNRLAKLLAASPLSAFALGLLVLTLGTAICEYDMITKGRATDAYFPWMFVTVHIGCAIWIAYFWRCLDFRWWSSSGWRFKLMVIRPFWMMGFALSSYTCFYVLIVVLDIESRYIPIDPAAFGMSTAEFMTLIREHLSRLFFTILANVAVVAVLSWFAASDDESRDELAAQMDLLHRYSV